MNKYRHVIFIVCLMILGMPAFSLAQGSNSNVLDRILDTPDEPADLPNRDSLIDSLEQLNQETEKFRNSVSKTGKQTRNAQELTPEGRGRTIEEIQTRINLLGRIYKDKKAQGPPAEGMPNKGMRNVDPMGQSVPANAVVQPNPIPEIKPPSLSKPPASKTVFGAERVLAEPVNSFELGNSLFQTGKVQAALDAYMSVDRSSITEFDSVWLDYMTATCHRRLGDIDSAEAIFRELANDKKSNAHPVAAASRWLKYIESSKSARIIMEDLDSQVDSLLKEAERHVNK